ncbi:MAG: type III pantothenate kinase [Defluviitaleaceae bacterium]|nr:type III pantothenate kinase [Defluviitaleaceae bacterium]MCL2836896.1 type III pantothenate kinase [Defluviitaleaceae bacterium]
MLLVIDLGNTNITFGVCNDNEVTAQWRLTTGQNRTIDEMGMNLVWLLENGGFKAGDIHDVVISSVVPKLLYPLTRAVNNYFRVEPIVVTKELELGLKLIVPATKELGSDRLVNCAAAYKLYGGPVIVIDYGTATTYDVIDGDGEFITGITAPGVKISADALFEKAALLGAVELAMPRSILATNTAESLQCGILFGCIGETEYIVSRLKRELSMPSAVVAATGGLCRVIASGTEGVFDHVVPALTLEGLRLIYNMNPRIK